MGKERLVIDTNIFIFAIGWGGKPKQLLDHVLSHDCTITMSICQFAELRRVLDYKKLGFTEAEKTRTLAIISMLSTILPTPSYIPNVCADKHDNHLLAMLKAHTIDYTKKAESQAS